MSMFSERIDRHPEAVAGSSAEVDLRQRLRRMIAVFNGPLGKIIADLIAEGQSEPAVLKEFYEQHVQNRRAITIAAVRNSCHGLFCRCPYPGIIEWWMAWLRRASWFILPS